MHEVLEAVVETVRWRDLTPLRMALRRESPLVARLHGIPDYGVCANYFQSDCRAQRRLRYGYGGADRWCLACEVVAAVEGDAYDHEAYLRTDIYGRPFTPEGGYALDSRGALRPSDLTNEPPEKP